MLNKELKNKVIENESNKLDRILTDTVFNELKGNVRELVMDQCKNGLNLNLYSSFDSEDKINNYIIEHNDEIEEVIKELKRSNIYKGQSKREILIENLEAVIEYIAEIL